MYVLYNTKYNHTNIKNIYITIFFEGKEKEKKKEKKKTGKGTLSTTPPVRGKICVVGSLPVWVGKLGWLEEIFM